MTFSAEQNASLSSPLSRDSIKTRDQAGRKLSYIEGWKAISEANRIFGFDGWNRETILLQETNRDLVDLKSSRGDYQQWRIGYIAKVRITVGTVTREGTGYGSGMGKPEALGDAVEGAIKEAETDAMKRALMTFGNPFGLALYDKDQEEVEKEPSRAVSSPVQAKTPPEATNPTITPAAWLQEALARIPKMTREELDKFEKVHGDRLARVRPIEPDLHHLVIRAMGDRQTALN